MVSPDFPEPPASVPPTSLSALDTDLTRLSERKSAWARLGIPERIRLLHQLQNGVQKVAHRWANAVCDAAGLDRGSPQAGEAWLGGPSPVARNIRLLIEALQQDAAPKPSRLSRRANGQLVAQVMPANTFDKILFPKTTAEVWIQPDHDATQGAAYRQAAGDGTVTLVLGAGNISSIGPMDVLYKLFACNAVVMLKMNPVNAYMGPLIAEAFSVLVKQGFLAIAYGGAEEGKHLCNHPHVDTLHITGSDRTHDAIIWGASTKEQEENKEAGTPVNTRPITSELGCVTPVLIVPGPWSDKEIAFQAAHTASMVAHNASFNCTAAKVVVTANGWPLRDKFLKALDDAFAAIGPRKAYYPGAKERYQRVLEHYPNARPLIADGEAHVPWTVLPDVPPNAEEFALSSEAFCGVLAEVSVEATNAREFLECAVDVANDEIWGTLSCALLIHPETERTFGTEFDQALGKLRFGAIAINCWTGLNYGLVTTTWGAFPGHPMEDIRSGRGVVHNSYLFDHPEKSVVRAPFMIKPTPAWMVQHKNLRALGEKLTAFEAAPSFFKLPGVIATALRG